MLFKKEFLLNDTDEVLDVISDEISDTDRWSEYHTMIFKYNDRFYRSNYSLGLTESQYESPYEYEPDEIECEEVFPTEVMITQYFSQKELAKL
jgi:hypothetical protein